MPALRLHLPPNLAAAAARDAVALRIELDPATAPGPELLPVLAFLQGLCGTAKPPAFIQLRRSQMRRLAAAADGLPVFVEAGRLVVWEHDTLLEEPEPAAPPPSPTSAISALRLEGAAHFVAIDGSRKGHGNGASL